MKTTLFLSAETLEESLVRADVWIFGRLRTCRVAWIMPDRGVTALRRAEFRGDPAWFIPKASARGLRRAAAEYAGVITTLRQAVREALREVGRPSLVQVRDDPLMAYVGWRVSREFSIPFVYQLSHLKEEECLIAARELVQEDRAVNYVKGVGGKLLRNFLLGRADLVFPISQHMTHVLRSYGLNDERMVVVPTCVDTSAEPVEFDRRAAQVRDELGLQGKDVLIYSGTMNRFRKLDFLLRLLLRLIPGHPTIHLLMVGDGPTLEDIPWLERQVAALGVADHVTFTGRVTAEDVSAHIRAADVGISPFPPNPVLMASAPIKLLEYLSMETPAVGSDIPDQRQVLTESGGGVCARYDEGDFAAAVRSLLTLPPTERRRLGKVGRAYVRAHRDVALIRDRIDQAYTVLLEGVAEEAVFEERL